MENTLQTIRAKEREALLIKLRTKALGGKLKNGAVEIKNRFNLIINT